MDNRQKGNQYEEKTCHYLVNQGYQIMETNYLAETGEIDIICSRQEVLAFVEVKYRQYDKYGYGSDAITPYKRHRIVQTARHYVIKTNQAERAIRFDVALWNDQGLEYYEGVFDENGKIN